MLLCSRCWLAFVPRTPNDSTKQSDLRRANGGGATKAELLGPGVPSGTRPPGPVTPRMPSPCCYGIERPESSAGPLLLLFRSEPKADAAEAIAQLKSGDVRPPPAPCPAHSPLRHWGSVPPARSLLLKASILNCPAVAQKRVDKW